jgi:hypothetical protein
MAVTVAVCVTRGLRLPMPVRVAAVVTMVVVPAGTLPGVVAGAVACR